MKDRIRKMIKALPLILPIVFVLFFIGYLTPKYDVRLYTDHIVGEGLGSVYLSQKLPFAYNYRAYFYFGSQLKTVDMLGFHYDVDELSLDFSEVSEADLLSFDVSAFGIPLGHYDFANFPSGDYDTTVISQTEDGKGIHLVFKDPTQTNSLDFVGKFLPTGFWVAYWTLFILITLLAALAASFAIERFPMLETPLLHISGIAAALLAGCWFCGSLPFVDYARFLVNWLMLIAMSLLLNSLTFSFLGTPLVMAFVTFWYFANYYVIMYRSKPIMPADLKAIGTAEEVIGGYILTPTPRMIVGLLVVLFYIAAIILRWRKTHAERQQTNLSGRMAVRVVGVAVSAILLVLSVSNPIFKSLGTFQWDMMILNGFHRDGMVLTFLKNLESARLEKPEGYSPEQANAYIEEYPSGTSEIPADAVRPTNIIMVMNEAFSDLRVVGLDSDIDVMPFIDSLDQNVIEGSLYVSVYGGGTCNTEFEALTGNSMAFMNAGAYPYTESITAPMFSLASYFHDRGYLTDAFHANSADNWNRKKVYAHLGFDDFFALNEYQKYTQVTMLHGHPSDSTDYRLIESVDELNKDRSRFMFNVTMQNHAAYDRWMDVEEAETLKGKDLNLEAKVYLSLVKASDEAVKQLVETYRNSDEPTMIVFFGDHQPSLSQSTRSQFPGKSGVMGAYQSKFFIWTNYETETVHGAAISANYLPWLILKRGNFEMPPYIRMLEELHSRYPVISAQGVIDADGNFYANVTELPDDPLLRKYRHIQYANLTGELREKWFKAENDGGGQ